MFLQLITMTIIEKLTIEKKYTIDLKNHFFNMLINLFIELVETNLVQVIFLILHAAMLLSRTIYF